MTNIVLDASVALAWGFPDEANKYADAVLVTLEGRQIFVPAIWPLEITNALVVATKRKRISQQQTQRFIELLGELAISEEPLSLNWSVSNVLPLAKEYNLSAYDASYLAIAIRHNAALATLDGGLKKAAQKAGVQILLAS